MNSSLALKSIRSRLLTSSYGADECPLQLTMYVLHAVNSSAQADRSPTIYFMVVVVVQGQVLKGGLMGKDVCKRLAIPVVLVALAVCCLSTPAWAFWYVHGTDYGVSSVQNGTIEVLVTLDAQEQGKGIWTSNIFVPADHATVETALQEAIISSESHAGIEAIHSYEYASLAQTLGSDQYQIKVFSAASQKPGTQTVHDGAGTLVTNASETTVQRYDHVYITLS